VPASGALVIHDFSGEELFQETISVACIPSVINEMKTIRDYSVAIINNQTRPPTYCSGAIKKRLKAIIAPDSILKCYGKISISLEGVQFASLVEDNIGSWCGCKMGLPVRHFQVIVVDNMFSGHVGLQLLANSKGGLVHPDTCRLGMCIIGRGFETIQTPIMAMSTFLIISAAQNTYFEEGTPNLPQNRLCNKLPVIKNSINDLSRCIGHIYGEVCSVTCRSSYFPAGILKCGRDGTWNTEFRCTKYVCSLPQFDDQIMPNFLGIRQNLEAGCSRYSRIGVRCEFTCKDSFWAVGLLECSTTGRWINSGKNRMSTCRPPREDKLPLPPIYVYPSTVSPDYGVAVKFIDPNRQSNFNGERSISNKYQFLTIPSDSQSVNLICPQSNTPISVCTNGGVSGIKYTVRVRARNQKGWGGFSDPSVVTVGAPRWPNFVDAKTVGSEQVTIYWEVTELNNMTPTIFFSINFARSQNVKNMTSLIVAKQSPVHVEGLHNNETYIFFVYGVNRFGRGGIEKSNIVLGGHIDIPNPPNDIVAVVEILSVSLTWISESGAIPRNELYRIEFVKLEEKTLFYELHTKQYNVLKRGQFGVQVNIFGLSSGSYKFVVSERNIVGFSARSNLSNGVRLEYVNNQRNLNFNVSIVYAMLIIYFILAFSLFCFQSDRMVTVRTAFGALDKALSTVVNSGVIPDLMHKKILLLYKQANKLDEVSSKLKGTPKSRVVKARLQKIAFQTRAGLLLVKKRGQSRAIHENALQSLQGQIDCVLQLLVCNGRFLHIYRREYYRANTKIYRTLLDLEKCNTRRNDHYLRKRDKHHKIYPYLKNCESHSLGGKMCITKISKPVYTLMHPIGRVINIDVANSGQLSQKVFLIKSQGLKTFQSLIFQIKKSVLAIQNVKCSALQNIYRVTFSLPSLIGFNSIPRKIPGKFTFFEQIYDSSVYLTLTDCYSKITFSVFQIINNLAYTLRRMYKAGVTHLHLSGDVVLVNKISKKIKLLGSGYPHQLLHLNCVATEDYFKCQKSSLHEKNVFISQLINDCISSACGLPSKEGVIHTCNNLRCAAPELLNPCSPYFSFPLELREDLPINEAEKMDVYSFGILIWEALHLREAWTNLKDDKVFELVFIKQQMPPFDSNLRCGSIQSSLKSLIMDCLQYLPSNRPTFAAITRRLELIFDVPLKNRGMRIYGEKYAIASEEPRVQGRTHSIREAPL
jgi:serine/threonine protein kinase